MPNTFELISSVTVGAGGASSMDFTSIPQTYTHLCLKVSGRLSSGSYGNIEVRFNGTGSGYANRVIQSDGSSVSTFTGNITSLYFTGSNSSGGTSVFSSGEMHISNYTNSLNKSTFVESGVEDNATTATLRLIANVLSTSAPVTSISVFPEPGYGSFVQHSTAYLYGIKNS
jgi:hypothetical protein